MKKKIVIVGGGISGLTAGIYAQKNGFDSIILEKHTIAGGECTGWDRQGFHIDNCIHWMTGTLPTKQLHRVWEEVGALGPDVPLIQNEAFMRIDGRDGRQIHVWRDINRLESELLESFPEDRREIRRLIKAIRGYQDIEVFSEKPFERFTLKDNLKALWSLRRVIRPHIRYSKISVRQYIRRFHNPLLRDVIRSYLPETYYVEAILYMYATFASGNGDLPAGGSLQMAERMVRRYEQLGGQLRTQAEVSHIVIEQGHATGVMLRKGEFIGADYIVAACDANVTFSRLLPDAFFDDYFRRRYNEQKNYPLFSNFNVYFGCDCTLRHLPDMISFRTDPYEICGKQHDILFVKQYGYEPGFAPEGKTVIQSLTLQFERDFDRWQHLRETDPTAYREEKLRAAQAIMQRIEQHLPELRGRLHIIETLTPYSFYRYVGAYKGAYMSFIRTPQVSKQNHDGRIKGLDNAYLAGQWLQMPGGLPNAVVTGKFAIQRICHDHRLEWCSD